MDSYIKLQLASAVFDFTGVHCTPLWNLLFHYFCPRFHFYVEAFSRHTVHTNSYLVTWPRLSTNMTTVKSIFTVSFFCNIQWFYLHTALLSIRSVCWLNLLLNPLLTAPYLIRSFCGIVIYYRKAVYFHSSIRLALGFFSVQELSI